MLHPPKAVEEKLSVWKLLPRHSSPAWPATPRRPPASSTPGPTARPTCAHLYYLVLLFSAPSQARTCERTKRGGKGNTKLFTRTPPRPAARSGVNGPCGHTRPCPGPDPATPTPRPRSQPRDRLPAANRAPRPARYLGIHAGGRHAS